MILIQPSAADIACAIPKDPNNCALAQAWKRQTAVPDAQIGIDKCYLPMKIKGKMVALRLKTNAATRRVLDQFDATGEFPQEGFVLRGIPPSQGIESQRSQQKRTRHRWETMGKESKQPRRMLHLRNASRRAQIVRDD
jgi:hypothetical protein